MARKDDKDNGASGDGEQTRRALETGAQAMDAGGRMAERGFAQMGDIGRRQADQVRSMLGVSARVYEDVGNLSRDDVDALMQTGTRLAKGVQDMSWEMMQYTQQSLQMSMRVANEMMSCRTVDDMLNVQRNFMRQSVDTFLQESARLLEMSSTMATDAVNPINDRFGGARQ